MSLFSQLLLFNAMCIHGSNYDLLNNGNFKGVWIFMTRDQVAPSKTVDSREAVVEPTGMYPRRVLERATWSRTKSNRIR